MSATVQKFIWMAVTPDKYELPVAVADTARELGNTLGVKENTIHSCISNAKKKGYKSIYVKVVID